jgi:hypothetical protein
MRTIPDAKDTSLEATFMREPYDSVFHLPDDGSKQSDFDAQFTDTESGIVRTFRQELRRHFGPTGDLVYFERHGIKA